MSVIVARDKHELALARNVNERTFKVQMPNDVTTIRRAAFGGCTGLTLIEIPNSVTNLGLGAFVECTGLTAIKIPNSVTEIGLFTFHQCTGLTSIEIPASVTEIGASTFHGCTGLTSIEIPNSVTEIGMHVYDGCTGLTSIKIPTSVTKMGADVFRGCSGLIAVEIPNSVTSLFPLFRSCTNLRFVVAPPQMVEAGSENLCPDCPLVPLVVLSTRETRLRVLREQFWTKSTHTYLSPAQRNTVFTVMMAGERMSSSVGVPSEMWVAILQHLRPRELEKPSFINVA